MITHRTVGSPWGSCVQCIPVWRAVKSHSARRRLYRKSCPVSASGQGAGISVGVFSAPQISCNIISHSILGAGTACNGNGANPTYARNDLFGNLGGDAICGIDGGNNANSDPESAALSGAESSTFGLDSPRQVAFSSCGVQHGASGVNTAAVAVEASSWGQLKSHTDETT